MKEATTLGCIYGMSSVFFPVFDKIAAARYATDLSTPPTRARCTTLWGATDLGAYDMSLWTGPKGDYYDADVVSPPQVHCDLIFASRLLPPTHSAATIVEWCSLFADDAPRGGNLGTQV